jgi:hypothetical protein
MPSASGPGYTTRVEAEGVNTDPATNTYDGAALTDRPNLNFHDNAGHGTGFVYRGNLTRSVGPGSTRNMTYDTGGVMVGMDDGNGHTLTITPSDPALDMTVGALIRNGDTQ